MSKLIIYDNILKNPRKNEENLSNALKYHILYESTSLYADLKLSDKIQEKLKLKLIGNKENNISKIFRKTEKYGKKYIEEEEDDFIGLGVVFGGGGMRIIITK